GGSHQRTQAHGGHCRAIGRRVLAPKISRRSESNDDQKYFLRSVDRGAIRSGTDAAAALTMREPLPTSTSRARPPSPAVLHVRTDPAVVDFLHRRHRGRAEGRQGGGGRVVASLLR